MPFEMRKLTSFSMERLYYELKLEVLEQMDPYDAIEMAKVNAGFQSVLLRRPWMVFGDHVHEIQSVEDRDFEIQKFRVSTPVQFSQTQFLLPFINRIQSCDHLRIRHISDGFATILNQLKFVKHLHFTILDENVLMKFLEIFRSKFESAGFHVRVEENPMISGLFKNFIVNQMKDCQKVSLMPADVGFHSFHWYCEVFAKTSIKFLGMADDYRGSVFNFEEVVRSIVEKQIPSKNLKAAFRMFTQYSQEMNDRIVDFLSQFPGMKRFNGENNEKVIQMVTKLSKIHFASSECLKGLILRRNIDSTRDCVYILHDQTTKYPVLGNRKLVFIVFYVQP